MPTRRDVLRAAAAGATALALPQAAAAADEKFTLPKLPYPVDFLEPVIDAETMTIHHTKHHQAYVDNLNKALAEGAPELLGKPLGVVLTAAASLPPAVGTAVRNNGGGHLNHSLFWTMMTKPGASAGPGGPLAKAIDASFGSLDGFKKLFAEAAAKRFGSGWAWLVAGTDKPLAVISTANQDPPLLEGKKPVLGIDVWEHAYYLKYRNARPKYVEEWFKVINWATADDLYSKVAA